MNEAELTRRQETARIALACLDLTSLNDSDDASTIEALCRRARGATGVPAAVCVWPRFVTQAKADVPSAVRVAAVANFPEGSTDVSLALRDTAHILDAGGDEVDLVLPWRALMGGDRKAAVDVVSAVRRASMGRTLKLILETGSLADEALVRQACCIGLDEGVDFLKTSTGKVPVGATPQVARAMLSAIAGHARRGEVGFKASGGVRRVDDAGVYVDLVREALGAAALTPARLRFGASGLLDDIEAVMQGQGRAAGSSAAAGY